MLVHKNDGRYIKACKREALFWSQDLFRTQSNEDSPEKLTAYWNKHYSGKEDQNFIEYVRTLGKFKKGLSIGGGFGQVELSMVTNGIVDYLEFLDISEGSNEILSKNAKQLGIDHKVSITLGDLNFLKLDENIYDVIICRNVLHHIINLEECLFELNKSLTNDGIIIIDEFVGAKKFQRTDTRINIIHTMQTYLKEKYNIVTKPFYKTNPKVLTNNCPFESIRSDELFEIINHYRGKTVHRESLSGYIIEDIGHYILKYDDKIIDVAINIFEKFIKENDIFPAPRLFGVYKKSNTKILLLSKSRSHKEIKRNIGVSFISERNIMYIGNKLMKQFPLIYSLLKNIYFFLRK